MKIRHRLHVILLLPTFIILMVVFVWWRMPLTFGTWDKQTIFVALFDIWHGGSTDEKAHAMWIDDDSTIGVYTVNAIANETGISPVFAVIADEMEQQVADSLVSWQQQGAGIVLHGLRHQQWDDWSEEQIYNDIKLSYSRLHEQGFDTTKIIKMVLPPHGCNNKTIRKVIQQQGLRMITGATLVNPDRHVFQYGRISITSKTDISAIRQLLTRAYQQKAFVIFATHSSIPRDFSEQKTREVLKIAKEMGFIFDIYE